MSADTLPAPVRNVLPGGRPSDYTDEQVTELLSLVREGTPLLRACRELDIPYGTAVAWQTNDPIFSQSLARAREASAHAYVEQAMTIADDVRESNEAISKAKLQTGLRQWLASKYAPKTYGDKIDVQGDLTINIAMKRYTPDAIDAEVVKPE